MSRAADSAGLPWAGRHFDESLNSSDDGVAEPAILAALAAFHEQRAGAEAVVDSIRFARLLIPLVAHAGSTEVDLAGRLVETSQELSIVTVEGPDGRTVMPVFSSVDAMRAWNETARPVPASGDRVALSAASDGTDLVVLDPTSSTEFVIRRPALWAIAQHLAWRPSYRDPAVEAAFESSIRSELGVLDVALADGDPRARLDGPELIVRLTLARGLSHDELDAIVGRLAQRWATSDAIAERVDSLKVELLTSE